MLDAALDDGAAHGGIFGDGVADDDEVQVAILGRGFQQLVAHHGEGFHHAGNVLLRPDIAGVEQERIVDLVALQDALVLALPGLRVRRPGRRP